MREHTIKLYKFNELDATAQERAIEKWREDIDWSINSEMISEDFKYDLYEKYDYPNDDVEWSLSHCQGDGVAFYGRVDNVWDLASRLLTQSEFDLLVNHQDDFDLSIEITRNGWASHYAHWNTMDVYLELYEHEEGVLTDVVRDVIDRFHKLVEQDVKDVSRTLEKEGYDQIEHLESDEYIRQELTENEAEFTSDGDIFVG
jgi:hypothetical protein